MVGTVLLIILFVLCVLLLLPVRVTGWFRDGKWAVAVYYAFFRVFHKEAEEKPSKEAEDQPVKAAEDKPVKEVAEKPAETPVDDPGEIPSDDAD